MNVRRRWYLVARGSACIVCKAHDWRAFAEPEERDLMSPCTLTPVYTIWPAPNGRQSPRQRNALRKEVTGEAQEETSPPRRPADV